MISRLSSMQSSGPPPASTKFVQFRSANCFHNLKPAMNDQYRVNGPPFSQSELPTFRFSPSANRRVTRLRPCRRQKRDSLSDHAQEFIYHPIVRRRQFAGVLERLAVGGQRLGLVPLLRLHVIPSGRTVQLKRAHTQVAGGDFTFRI